MTSLSLCSFSIVRQGTRLILFVVAVALLNSNAVESARDRNVTWNSFLPPDHRLGVWNPKFKSENNCQMFHTSELSERFFSWPEGDFEFCCGCGIRNYTYTLYSPRLITTLYYDVGLVDECLPYWKCPILSNWVRLNEYVTFHVPCEMGDIQRLYSKRLMRVIGINGLVQTALPLVGILEFGVFLAIVAFSYCCTWITPHAPTRSWSQALSLLCRENYGNIVANLVHLCVLVVIGNCFMEATAHSNPYEWESGMFVKWAQYYLFAPSLLTVAIFVHQTADWVAACSSIKDDVPNGDDDVANRFVSISEDWRWQPVSGQVVVLVLTGSYCVYNSDDKRTEFVSFLLGVVVVFSIWSGIFSCALLHRSIRSLFANLRILLGYKLHTPPPSSINSWMTSQSQADTLGFEV